MVEPKSLEAVALQSVWRRTHTGRVLRDNAVNVMEKEYDKSRGLCECPNCGFIYGEQWFVGGCPNCNSIEGINDGN